MIKLYVFAFFPRKLRLWALLFYHYESFIVTALPLPALIIVARKLSHRESLRSFFYKRLWLPS